MICILQNTRFEIITKDPREIKSSEALIIPNTPALNLYEGVSGEILNLLDKKELQELKTTPGNSIITLAGELTNYKYIIHSCIFDEYNDPVKNVAIIGQSIASSLDLAYKNGIRKITISYFPENVLELKTPLIANVLIKITLAYIKKRPFINRVLILTESNYEYEIYSDHFKKLMNMF